MSLLPENLERYRKFIAFILKYRNSEVFKTASDNAMNLITDETVRNEVTDYQKPEEFVEDLKKMGPTYVKIGQTLSTRPDLLPDNYLKALSTLQDDLDAIPYEEVQKTVEEEIGTKISKAFQSFDEKPIASASIGQVHRAVLRSGKNVVVKIQRPGVRKEIIEEMDTLKELASLAVKHTEMGKMYGLDEVIDEMRYILLSELDYKKEAENLIVVGDNMTEFENIIVPQPVLDYSSSKVLTMDYIEGTKITSINPLLKTEINFEYLVDELIEAYMKQILYDGIAHADPHPGNVHLTAENKVVLMDLGMVAKFSPTLQDDILKLLIAMSKYDGEETSNVLLNISVHDKLADVAGFKKEVNRLVLESQNKTAKDMQTGKVLIQLNSIAAYKGIRIPVELNILGKILMNMDQIVAVLTPNYDLQNAIKRNVESIMHSKMLEQLKPENIFAELLEAKKLFFKLPERLNKITENLANNEFEIKVDTIDEQRLTDGFQKVANRIAIGLIIAALIIGASLLMRVPTSYTIFGYPAIAIIFFLSASIFAVWFVLKIVVSDETFRKKKK
nr:AarF/UbiB family protein [uncultured Flavobacterium sp.]